MTNNFLQEVYNHKLLEVRNAKKAMHLNEICAKIKCQEIPKDFAKALKYKLLQGKNAIISEIKKASPSKGLIRQNFNAAQIAQDYQKNGAACLSVLTDSKYFMGSLSDLQEARLNTDLPILRKDFIVDEYQIYEAKMYGADCILLIVAMLDDQRLQELEKCAILLGLSVLIEIHDEEELQRALKLKSPLIGINNRNLKTLKVDLQNSLKLAPLVPPGRILVGESGIKTKADIALLKTVNINCFLIGEHFMAQADAGQALKELVG